MTSAGQKTRKTKQRKRKRYQKLREDLQLSGDIAVEPEGAVRDERVDSTTQDEQQFIGLDIQAATKGWATPELVKRQVVNRLAEVFFEESSVVMTKDGRVLEIPPDRHLQVKAANALLTADQRQYERDHPVEAGKAKGASAAPVINLNFFEMVAQAAQRDRGDDVEQRIAAIEHETKEVGGGEPT